jgi:hypothetical protein
LHPRRTRLRRRRRRRSARHARLRPGHRHSQRHYITPNPGGQGAGRDAIEFILAAQGKLDSAIATFLDADNPAAAAADIGSGKM